MAVRYRTASRHGRTGSRRKESRHRGLQRRTAFSVN